jgi:hypothetical protein
MHVEQAHGRGCGHETILPHLQGPKEGEEHGRVDAVGQGARSNAPAQMQSNIM